MLHTFFFSVHTQLDARGLSPLDHGQERRYAEEMFHQGYDAEAAVDALVLHRADAASNAQTLAEMADADTLEAMREMSDYEDARA